MESQITFIPEDFPFCLWREIIKNLFDDKSWFNLRNTSKFFWSKFFNVNFLREQIKNRKKSIACIKYGNKNVINEAAKFAQYSEHFSDTNHTNIINYHIIQVLYDCYNMQEYDDINEYLKNELEKQNECTKLMSRKIYIRGSHLLQVKTTHQCIIVDDVEIIGEDHTCISNILLQTSNNGLKMTNVTIKIKKSFVSHHLFSGNVIYMDPSSLNLIISECTIINKNGFRVGILIDIESKKNIIIENTNFDNCYNAIIIGATLEDDFDESENGAFIINNCIFKKCHRALYILSNIHNKTMIKLFFINNKLIECSRAIAISSWLYGDDNFIWKNISLDQSIENKMFGQNLYITVTGINMLPCKKAFLVSLSKNQIDEYEKNGSVKFEDD